MYIGQTQLKAGKKEIKGEFTDLGGELFYKIHNYDQMPDFFISIISSSDHWMFISSNGSLTAGRKDRDNALFPYITEDKIHDYRGLTGSKSQFIVHKKNKAYLWEPFALHTDKIYSIQRNIYKNFYGNKIIFEEINNDLKVLFQYGWCNSNQYGFIKKSKLVNNDDEEVQIALLDGIKNILPAGSDYNFQNEFSNLLDAYKKNELIEKSGLGLFTLSSIPVDRAEPSESLYATTVFSSGIKNPKILLSNAQVDSFKYGYELKTELDVRARRGAYYINSDIRLPKGGEKTWMIVAEINQDGADVSSLDQFLTEKKNVENQINEDIEKGTENLKIFASKADGMQITNTPLCYARHYSNSMYNLMRGGIFANDYWVDTKDYKNYLRDINRMVSKEFQGLINQLPDRIEYYRLVELSEDSGNDHWIRITKEYLPITFSRRHGDPSRPWNKFSIETKNDDGTIKYHYEGNWRDIFQNWEALCYSFPEYTEGIICKFVNASTIDGYNPYRITRDGIDWECPDPNDPWSYIGYWGDHQVIYLQKFLELSDRFHPGALETMLTKEIFTYANVPYRIKDFEEIVKNPQDTIEFDEKLNREIIQEVEYLGADARLLKDNNKNDIYRVNLIEKILVTLLSKVSNFIPEAGIWLNTQRPEWNDANNALVGNGTSMVTLYYLRRFLKFWQNKFASLSVEEVSISEEVATLLEAIYDYLNQKADSLKTGFTDKDRFEFANNLGKAHSKYRKEIYAYSFSGDKKQVEIKKLNQFISLCLQYVDQSIQANQREDGLYHAYNLITFNSDSISIRYLYEMLEGQVAVLSAGILSPKESLNVLDALKNSQIYREDQYSYMLYPDRNLPRFEDKNKISADQIRQSRLLTKLLEDNDYSIIKPDQKGNYFFNKDFRNADILKNRLDNLRSEGYAHMTEEKQKVLDLYEEMFDHKSFTGRSGTFYGYEGLGSIYWHMVSKLLLAVQECFFEAVKQEANEKVIGKLKEHYYEIKAGIGLYKSPALYGAFPTDAYSHTPGNAGVKQPGLTGQVKEDIISRFGEMGLQINDGKISFNTSLLNREEVLDHNDVLSYYAIPQQPGSVDLETGQVGFTYCQVPVVLKKSSMIKIVLTFNDDQKLNIPGNEIDMDNSREILLKSGKIKLIEVFVKNL